MAGDAHREAGDVDRLESWQLPGYLQYIQGRGAGEVTWNRDKISLEAALGRAAGLSPTATVVVDGATIYVAEPDHSADNQPASFRPIQLGPRRDG